MPSEKIEIFIEVADQLCFSAVAKKHYTTQPTISRQISALEEAWGLQLFIRTNKGLRLTAEGSIMLSCCKKMRQNWQNSLKQARDFKALKGHYLRLGFLEIMDTERIFMPYLHKFSEQYPDMEISISSHSFADLRSGLKSGKFDVIYTYDFELPSLGEDIVADYLAEVKIFFALSQKHPLFKKEALAANDLEGNIFYLPEVSDSEGRERELQMLLNAQNIVNRRIRFVPNVESVILQMRLGKGIALLDECVKNIQNPQVRCLELSRPCKPLNLISVWKKENLNPLLPLFVNQQEINI